MKSIRRIVPMVAGMIGVAGAWGAASVGCGSSGGGTGPVDSGVSDATMDAEDAPSEGAPGMDGSSDTSMSVDTSVPPVDTGSTVDSGVSDTGSVIGDSSVNDSGITDSGAYDAAAAALAFPSQLAAAMCSQYAACCGTTGDASTFNWQACYTTYATQGFHGSIYGTNLYANGNIAFDPVQAQACLNAIASIDCVANQLTAAESVQLYASCFAAYHGTLPTGSACAQTLECAPGNYCLPVDGGVGDAGAIGICQPLAGQGGSCAALGANQGAGQTICSYRGSAANGLFCQNIEPDAAATQTPVSAWTCQPQWAAGAGCWTNQDCASYVCHEYSPTDYQCAAAGNWSNAATCATYLTDGG